MRLMIQPQKTTTAMSDPSCFTALLHAGGARSIGIGERCSNHTASGVLRFDDPPTWGFFGKNLEFPGKSDGFWMGFFGRIWNSQGNPAVFGCTYLLKPWFPADVPPILRVFL